MTAKSVFEEFTAQAWPYRYGATLHLDTICGGTPSDPNVAAGWIRAKMGLGSDHDVQADVSRVMVERGITRDEAAEVVNISRHLNGFKREADRCSGKHGATDPAECRGELYIGGRQLKAAVKEAAMVCVATGKLPKERWGKTSKGLRGFVAEHIQVEEDRLYLGTCVPTGINQRFVATHNGTGIQYEEYVEDPDIDATVSTDYEFTREQWAMIWETGRYQGLGATRSQGYGRYTLTRWDRLS